MDLHGPPASDSLHYWYRLLTGSEATAGLACQSSSEANVKSFIDWAREQGKQCLVANEPVQWRQFLPGEPLCRPQSTANIDTRIHQLEQRFAWLRDNWDRSSLDLVWLHEDGLDGLSNSDSTVEGSAYAAAIDSYTAAFDRSLEGVLSGLTADWLLVLLCSHDEPSQLDRGQMLFVGDRVTTTLPNEGSFIDVAPTLLDCLGVTTMEPMHGCSLWRKREPRREEMSEDEILRERLRGLGYIE